MSDTVLLDRVTPEITQLTLNRPEKLNAMNEELIDAIYARCDEIEDDPECRVVDPHRRRPRVLRRPRSRWLRIRAAAEGLGRTGGGDGRAAAHRRGDAAPAGAAPTRHRGGERPRGRRRTRAGARVGHPRVPPQSARFNVAFVRIGLSGCDVGVSWLLPRIVGAARATEMMLTGRLVDADGGRTDGTGDRASCPMAPSSTPRWRWRR